MSFQPIITGSGYSGWRNLNTTLLAQKAQFSKGPEISRDVENFRQNISSVKNYDEMTSDYQLLKVSLGAFDLIDDLPNRFFINRILSEDVSSSDSLVNKLQDTRYQNLSNAFPYGSPGLISSVSREDILTRFVDLSFERAVGEQNNVFRIAMGLGRQLIEMDASTVSEDAGWYKVLGTPSVRVAFETLFSLPPEFVKLDVEKQKDIMMGKVDQRFGTTSLADLADGKKAKDLITGYILQSQIAQSSAFTSGNIALQLLGVT